MRPATTETAIERMLAELADDAASLGRPLVGLIVAIRIDWPTAPARRYMSVPEKLTLNAATFRGEDATHVPKIEIGCSATLFPVCPLVEVRSTTATPDSVGT